jgi:hypothetical protein
METYIFVIYSSRGTRINRSQPDSFAQQRSSPTTSEISDQKMDNNWTEIDVELNNNELSENVIKKLENEKQQKIDIEEKYDSNSGCTCFGYKPSQIKWTNVIWLIVIHSLAIYAYIHALLNPVKVWTVVFVSIIAALSGFGMRLRFIFTFF